MSLTLYNTLSSNIAGVKIEVLLRFLDDIKVEFNRIPPTEWKSEEYLKINPLGKVPSLVTPEGPITESLTIMRYLARKAGKMYGTNAAETAAIDQWLEYFNTQVQPNMARFNYATFGIYATTKEQYDFARRELFSALKAVDTFLKENQFLGGKEISIADVAYVAQLRSYYRLAFDEKSRKNLPNFAKWFEDISATPQFMKHYGKLWLCQKEFTPDFTIWGDAKN